MTWRNREMQMKSAAGLAHRGESAAAVSLSGRDNLPALGGMRP
jgi:hypothetical protein